MKLPDRPTNKRPAPPREPPEPGQRTLHGPSHYTMHLVGQPQRNPEAAARAVARIKQIGSKYAPSRTQGATASIRKLRDRGE